MADIINMADQLSGLPIESLICGPLQAACEAEVMPAATTGFQDADSTGGPHKQAVKANTLPVKNNDR